MNKKVFGWYLNTDSDGARCVSPERVFHILGASTEKDPSHVTIFYMSLGRASDDEHRVAVGSCGERQSLWYWGSSHFMPSWSQIRPKLCKL